MANEYKGLIVETNAGGVPEDDLTRILKAYPSVWGWAAIYNGKILHHSDVLTADTEAKELNEVLAILKDKPETMQYFGKYPDTFDKRCHQPFVALTHKDDTPALLVFMEGDFGDHWGQERGDLSPEYDCFQNYLLPKILDLNELCEGNVDKLLLHLKKPSAYKELIGSFGNRGVIKLFGIHEGKAVSNIIDENEKEKEFSWGAVSNEIPEEEPAHIPESDVALPQDKTMSLKERRELRKMKEAADAVATAPAPKPVTTPGTTLAEQGLRKETGDDYLHVTDLFKAAKKTWDPTAVSEGKDLWQEHYGTCPNEYKIKNAEGKWILNPAAKMPRAKLVSTSSLRNISDLTKGSGLKGMAAIDAAAAGKGSTSTTSTATNALNRPSTPAPSVPVIPPGMRNKAIEYLNTLDLKSRKIMTPDEIKEVEKKFNSVFTQLGNLPREAEDQLKYEEMLNLCKTLPEVGATFWFNCRTAKMNYRLSAEAQEEKKVEEQPAKTLSLKERRALRKQAQAS